MSIQDKLAAIPVTLQYQAETLYLVPETHVICDMVRVCFVNRAGVVKFMAFIGENTTHDWGAIEAENTKPYEPSERKPSAQLSQEKHAVYMRQWYAKKKAQLSAIMQKGNDND